MQNLPIWREEHNTLVKEFTFDTFKEAIDFINHVALIAEQMNHHPDIHNIYNKVTLTLSTHDAGDTITDKDTALAAAIDEIPHV